MTACMTAATVYLGRVVDRQHAAHIHTGEQPRTLAGAAGQLAPVILEVDV